MRFVDVKNDVAFRKIFGNEKKTEILISFLNAILELPQGKLITKVKIENPYQLPKIKELKSTILDVRATDERGISYIIEMQVEEPDGFDKRVQYYTAKEYSEQIKRGDDYPRLNQVIFIGILNFDFFKDDKNYITRHRTVNVRTQKTSLDGMEYNFVELKKFKKKLEDLENLTDKWIYFIKNAETLEIIPDHIDDEGLKKAYENAEKHTWTKKELHDYDYAFMRKQDIKGIKQLAVRRAAQKAFGEGLEHGIEKGIEKGLEKGKIDIAIKLHNEGLPIEFIMKVTGLDEEVIESILKN